MRFVIPSRRCAKTRNARSRTCDSGRSSNTTAHTRDLDFRELNGVDLLSGGPPCQPFSIGGLHLGPRDQRNMWPEAIRAVAEIRPTAFILENVRGLFRPAFEVYLEYITLQLTYPDLKLRIDEAWRHHLARLRQYAKGRGGKNAAYRVLSRAINAADYGAPQKRHRAISSSAWHPNSAIIGASQRQRIRREGHLRWLKHVERNYWTRHGARRICEPASKSRGTGTQARSQVRRKKPRSGLGRPCWTRFQISSADEKEKIAGHWQHPGARAYDNHTGSCLDEPAKALKAGDHGVPGSENMLAGRQGDVRYFTIREMARLQGLPG